jgi:hypothetical protein
MQIVGSQRRELIEHTEYKLISLAGGEAILLNTETNHRELWYKRDDFAGYVIVIEEIGYEFVREIK